MFFPSCVGRGTANPLWRGSLWYHPRAGHAGGGSHCAGKMQRRLLILTVAQFILLAGVGHATMRDGVAGTLYSRLTMPAFPAAARFAAVATVVYCMRMAQDAGVNMLLAP